MTELPGSARIVPFWPGWTRTLDAMVRSLARARSRCRRCGTLLHVNLEALSNRLGGSAALIDQSDACTVVGCGGTVYYLAAPATGATYHVLIDSPALLEGVVDPVGLPFRSRWHSMVPVGPAALASGLTADVVELRPDTAGSGKA